MYYRVPDIQKFENALVSAKMAERLVTIKPQDKKSLMRVPSLFNTNKGASLPPVSKNPFENISNYQEVEDQIDMHRNGEGDLTPEEVTRIVNEDQKAYAAMKAEAERLHQQFLRQQQETNRIANKSAAEQAFAKGITAGKVISGFLVGIIKPFAPALIGGPGIGLLLLGAGLIFSGRTPQEIIFWEQLAKEGTVAGALLFTGLAAYKAKSKETPDASQKEGKNEKSRRS